MANNIFVEGLRVFTGTLTDNDLLHIKVKRRADMPADEDMGVRYSSFINMLNLGRFALKAGDNITGDFVFSNNRGIFGKTVAGASRVLIKVGTDDKIAVGTSTSAMKLFSLSDIVANVNNVDYTMYHSGNSNLNSIDWRARDLVADRTLWVNGSSTFGAISIRNGSSLSFKDSGNTDVPVLTADATANLTVGNAGKTTTLIGTSLKYGANTILHTGNYTGTLDGRYVLKTQTVNNKALSGNITLTPADVGAVNKAGDTMTGQLTLDGINAYLRVTTNANKSIGMIVEGTNPSTYSAPLRIIRSKHNISDTRYNDILHTTEGNMLFRRVTPDAADPLIWTPAEVHGSILFDLNNSKVTASGDPTNADDLVNKRYADTKVPTAGGVTIAGWIDLQSAFSVKQEGYGVRLTADTNRGYVQSGHLTDTADNKLWVTGYLGRTLSELIFHMDDGASPIVRWNGVNKKVFHQGFLPTAAEVGALPASGLVVTSRYENPLTLSSVNPTLSFNETDANKSYHIIADGLRFRINEDSSTGLSVIKWDYFGSSNQYRELVTDGSLLINSVVGRYVGQSGWGINIASSRSIAITSLDRPADSDQYSGIGVNANGGVYIWNHKSAKGYAAAISENTFAVSRDLMEYGQRVYSPNNIPSLSTLGAAPSGFGIGERSIQKDPNTLHVGGLWRDTVSGLAGITLPYDGSPSSRAIGVTGGGGLRTAVRTGSGTYVWKKVYSEVEKPTAADIGLSNVPNTVHSANPDVSTVPLRDGSGDIAARLFRATYADQSTISGGLVFRINNSTDNYLRVCTDKGAIRDWLGVSANSSASQNWADIVGKGVVITAAGVAEMGKFIDLRETGSNLDYNTRLESNAAGLRISTNLSAKSLFMGCKNDGWAHFDTDSTNGFYFYRRITSITGFSTKEGDGNVGSGYFYCEPQGGAWVDWQARTTSLQVSCPNSASAYPIWRASQWGSRHLAAMEVYAGGSNTAEPTAVMHVGNRANAFTWFESGDYNIARNLNANDVYIRSDASLKTNVKPLENSLAGLMKLEPSEYDKRQVDSDDYDMHEEGLIAQLVEEQFPNAVHTDKQTGLKSLKPYALIARLIHAVQEQQQQIDDLKKLAKWSKR